MVTSKKLARAIPAHEGIKVSIRSLDRILFVVCEGVAVNGLQGIVRSPSSPLLDICVADSSCMEGADHVVPVIMDADMGQAVAGQKAGVIVRQC